MNRSFLYNLLEFLFTSNFGEPHKSHLNQWELQEYENYQKDHQQFSVTNYMWQTLPYFFWKLCDSNVLYFRTICITTHFKFQNEDHVWKKCFLCSWNFVLIILLQNKDQHLLVWTIGINGFIATKKSQCIRSH